METWDIPRLRGVTHAYAFFVAVIAAALLIALTPGGAPRMAAAVYGVGLCALFGGSGLYHRWRWNPRWRPVLRRVDHSTIYLFIAASYTPVGLLVLSGTDAVGRADHGLVGRAGRRDAVRRVDQRAAVRVRHLLRRAGLGRRRSRSRRCTPSCRWWRSC